MATREQVEQFMRTHWPHALAVAQATGTDPRILMAQAGIESGWGTAAPGNNLFGHKGPGQVLDTMEAGPDGKLVPTKASFRVYDDPAQAWAEHGNNGIIQAIGKLPYDQQAAALGKSGYASAPGYGDTVGGIASSLTVPTDVQPSKLPLPSQTINGPGPGGGGAQTPLPQQGLLASAADPGANTYNSPDINTRTAFSDKEIGEWSKMGDAGGGNYGALGSGLTSAGTKLMMTQSPTPKLQMVESANIPQAQGQGNPNFLQQLAQRRLLRKQQGGQ